MEQVTNDPAAQAAVKGARSIRFFEGKEEAVDSTRRGRRRAWVHLTRDGRLILSTRWGVTHGGQAEPSVSQFATEAQICAYLRSAGIADLSGIHVTVPRTDTPMRVPGDVLLLLRKPLGDMSASELRRIVDFVYDWPR